MKLKAPIIPVHNCAQLSPTVPNGEQHPEPGFVNPFGFEQTVKKIELEDQSSEIERLNEIIKNLKEENIKLNKKVSEFTDVREEFLKLQKDINDLEVILARQFPKRIFYPSALKP